jgi:alkylation response protein AidB-like acyl-CoA dehydrogenase
MTAADTLTTAARPDDESRARDLCATLLAEAPPATTGATEFLGRQYDLGLAWVHFPEGFGGLGLSPKLQKVVNETLGAAGAPRAGVRNPIGHGMGAPTVVTHGSDAQKRRYLRPLFTNEEIWCQLFSEPGAGSDVAGLSSRAVRDGDEWVVNGQKVWTTLAHMARWGMLVARTDSDAPKHKGLTYFVVDMHAPGVEVRPLYQITGEAEFNEVYFTDVRIPDAERLGEVGEGWRVSLTTLMNERVSIGGQIPARGSGFAGELVKTYRATGPHDAATRDRVIGLWARAEVLRLTNIRASHNRSQGTPGPEGSISKLAMAEVHKDISECAVDLLGAGGLLFPAGYPMARPETTALWSSPQQAFLRSRANSIEGGTTEIMKNILAERVLGLPGDVRVDKDRPWIEVPRS